MRNLASFYIVTFFLIGREHLSCDLINQVLKSFDVSNVLSFIMLNLLLNRILVISDVSGEILDVIVDLTSLFTNCFFHVLDKTRPFVSSVTFFYIWSKSETINSLFKETKTAHDDFEFVVEDASLAIL